MSKQNVNLNKGFSIEELEDRHELTVALPADNLEAGGRQEGGEGNEGGTGGDGGDFDRCGGNSNDMGPQ